MPGWCPILAGRAREGPPAAVRALADPASGSSSGRRDVPWTVAHDRALLCAYLAQLDPRPTYQERIASHLHEALAFAAETPSGPELFGGITAIGWVVQHIEHMGVATDIELDVVDEALQGLLLDPPADALLDLVLGLAGFGLYFIERSPSPGGRVCIEAAVAALEQAALTDDMGLFWPTPARHLPGFGLDPSHGMHVNLGVSHGVGGIVVFLAGARAVGVAPERLDRLLDGATRWLWSQRLPASAPACFPEWVVGGRSPRGFARPGWCYGDVGLAAALLAAADVAGDDVLRGQALELGRQAAEHALRLSTFPEVGLCHGAAGLAHLFNRMYQATDEPLFRDASMSWYERLLLSWRATEDGSLLLGNSGVALALLAAASPVEPQWDRLLGASHRRMVD